MRYVFRVHIVKVKQIWRRCFSNFMIGEDVKGSGARDYRFWIHEA